MKGKKMVLDMDLINSTSGSPGPQAIAITSSGNANPPKSKRRGFGAQYGIVLLLLFLFFISYLVFLWTTVVDIHNNISDSIGNSASNNIGLNEFKQEPLNPLDHGSLSNQQKQQLTTDVTNEDDKHMPESESNDNGNNNNNYKNVIEKKILIDSGTVHEGEKSNDGKLTIATKRDDGIFWFPLSQLPPVHGDGTFFLAPYEHGETIRIFEPGSEKSARIDVLKKCYIDPTKYKRHSRHDPMCSISKRYKLIFFLIPKSGSSTGRHIVKNDFEGKDSWCPASNLDIGKEDRLTSEGYFIFCVLRNPISRFYASYDEVMARRLGFKEYIPPEFSAFMEPLRGKTYDHHYKFMFDTKEGIANLTWSFNRFVQDWNGYDSFDVHLGLQTPMLMSRAKPGKVRYMDMVFDTHLMEETFNKVAERVHAPKPNIIAGRAYPRRFNVSAVLEQNLEKICKISSIDFCCLNYPLPEVCKHLPEGRKVACREFKVSGDKDFEGEIKIEPVLV